VTAVLASGRLARRRRARQRILTEASSVMLSVVLLIWSLTPVYNMLLVALDPEEGEIEFAGNLWTPEPSLEGFRAAVMQDARYLEDFWYQYGNSLYIGLATTLLTMLVGSMASFALGRMHLAKASLLTNAAVLTYAIPAPFLIVPLYRIMHGYGLLDNLWAVIVAQVTVTIPFAILILRQYARLIPLDLDDAARLDGASVVQLYLRIYLPLTAPALAVIAGYSLLLSWNDYIYQFVLLSSQRNMTVSVMQAALFVDADARWNAMMAAAMIYAALPIIILYALGRYIATALARGCT
jgi:multiple sugar transport system permease protein